MPSSLPGIPPVSSDPLGTEGDVGTPTNTSTQVYQTPSSLPGIPPVSSDLLGRAGDAGTPTNTSTQVYQTPSSLPGIPLTSSDPSGRAGDVGTPTNTSMPLWLIYIVGHPSPGTDTCPKNEYRNREFRSIGI